MTDTESKKEFEEGRIKMDNERSILLKLTDLLEREKLISVEERNRAVMLICQEENT